MYAITENAQKINGKEVQTFSRNVKNGKTELIVEAGTTGFAGGDSREKGGRAYFSFACNHGDYYFAPILDNRKKMIGFEAACCGDDAVCSLIEMLNFAMQAFVDQCE